MNLEITRASGVKTDFQGRLVVLRGIIFLLTLCFPTALAIAEEKQVDQRSAAVTLSLIGPVSTNLGDYDRTKNHFCIGLIGCSSQSLDGFSLSYVYNYTSQEMSGIALSGVGNISGENARGFNFSFFSNLAIGQFNGFQLSLLNITLGEKLNGLQAGFVNYSQGNTAGMQLGPLNIIAGEDSGSRFAVQYGLVNVSNQSRVIPIGLLNIVRGGRFSFGINRDAIGLNRLSLHTGSQYSYFIFHFDLPELNSDLAYKTQQTSLRGIGLAGAIPVSDSFMAKYEYLLYAPSGWEIDNATVNRLLGEYNFSPYFAMDLGLERLVFRHPSYDRSYFFENKKDKNISLTAGFSVNFLGWWR